MTETENMPADQTNVTKQGSGYKATVTRYFNTEQEAVDWTDNQQDQMDREQPNTPPAATPPTTDEPQEETPEAA